MLASTVSKLPLMGSLPLPAPETAPFGKMSHIRPNILFIFADQFRADCIAALGNDRIRTPNIDRLVREGTVFSRCYTPSPVCMPARYALTSGLPPHLTGCVDNQQMTEKHGSFIEALGTLGYQTHGVGKMHFPKAHGDWGFQSRDHAEELAGESARDDYRTFLAESGFGHVRDPYGFRSEYYYIPQPSQLPDKLHSSTWVADRSIDFLRRRDARKPFFLWSSFIKPHPPFESPYPWSRLYRMHEIEGPFLPDGFAEQQNFWNKVQARYKYMDGGRSGFLDRMIIAAYYSMISHVDYQVGRILDALGPEIDNTLIVFSSDHGEMLGDYGCYGKRSMLDASAHVPLLVRLPSRFAPGKTVTCAASLLDLYPTFVEIAGGQPDSVSEGLSLQRLQHWHDESRCVFSQFSQNQLGLYMVANSEWKYIYSAADNKEWLYHGGFENINLAGVDQYEPVKKQMKGRLIERFRTNGYELPLDGDDWARFPSPELPADQDDGLLFQDPPELSRDLAELGPDYQHAGVDTSSEKHNLLQRLAKQSRIPARTATKAGSGSE
ncbi:MAG: hypothetical protein D6781_02845 [Verrucomicrobia bacterium]|nr:MAG: hypothetical protein D6781_02845 [Verrucomicrobiota bacterium]